MKTLGTLVTVAVAILLALFLYIVQPGASGVVASLRLGDGSEYLVQQVCNWSPEPYTVTFFMRAPGGAWGSCYIDHQADRWRHVAMTYDAATDTVTVFKRGTWQAALDRRHQTFSFGDGAPKATGHAPGGLQKPEYPFP